MIKFYEFIRIILEPFFPALLFYSRHDLKKLLKQTNQEDFLLLDVGGRKSPYTIGLPVAVTIIDLPRKEELQKNLNLGLSEKILNNLNNKRSNIHSVVIGDMLNNNFPDDFFDGVVSIEVIEHIENDDLFLEQINRVIKPGAWVYLSTPNGDYVKNEPPNFNPDHKRHYTKAELTDLLKHYFDNIEVWYGIKTGINRYRGLRSFSLKHPFNTMIYMFSNTISIIESRNLKSQSRRTAHLFAFARKK